MGPPKFGPKNEHIFSTHKIYEMARKDRKNRLTTVYACVVNGKYTSLLLLLFLFPLSLASEPIPSKDNINNSRYLTLLRHSLLGKLHTTKVQVAFNKALSFEPDKTKWGAAAITMLPEETLISLGWMVDAIVADQVPAHNIVELGVWRGGGSIYAAASLQEAVDNANKRGKNLGPSYRVLLCDSFQGLPISSTLDKDSDWWWTQHLLKVDEDQVRENFRNYLPDVPQIDNVGEEGDATVSAMFFKGYVRESIPRVIDALPKEGSAEGDIAILRIDLDMYESYFDSLFLLAGRVPPGGFIVADDYNCALATQQATDEFRLNHTITDPLYQAGPCAVWWRVSKRIVPRMVLLEEFERSRVPISQMPSFRLPFEFDNGEGGNSVFYVEVFDDGGSVEGDAKLLQAVEKTCRDMEFFITDHASCVETVLPHAMEKWRAGRRNYLGEDL